MELKSSAFKAYDIRGKFPEEVNEELAYRIGRVFPTLFNAKRVAVGHDIRLSGPDIQKALELGLTEMGCEVVDIGQCGTGNDLFCNSSSWFRWWYHDYC